MTLFKDKLDFNSRKKESMRIIQKYPDKIPVIVEKLSNSTILEIQKNKFLVPVDMLISQFSYIMRKSISLKPHEGFFIFINGVIVPNAIEMHSIYQLNKDDDGFLYLKYSSENTFG
jgi:GABA(A) receptor-associated protein